MILSHFPETTLQSMLKNFDVLLDGNCKNRDNVLRFREDCIQELCRKYDLYKEKPI